MFERYGQKLNLRVDERKLEVVKEQEGMTYSYPYSSVADTLQRIIFYLAAIESNTDAVLLFEEPEAHSFPVYVARLWRRIVESRRCVAGSGRTGMVCLSSGASVPRVRVRASNAAAATGLRPDGRPEKLDRSSRYRLRCSV